MKKVIELLKNKGVSLPLIDYSGLIYKLNQGSKVFQIYPNEDAEGNYDRVTLWISKHYWDKNECSLNDFVNEIECSAYLEYFASVEDAIAFVEAQCSSFKTIWKNSEKELEEIKCKEHFVYIAPYNQEILINELKRGN